jgi:DNA-binding response OmpR family regulator
LEKAGIEQTILIADDDEEIREVIRMLLEKEGYSVIEAAHGADAIDKMNDTVSLIILDVMMPHFSGIEACTQLRQKYVTPILFLTAKSTDADKVEGFMAGGDDYLVKPFSYTELTSRVKALIRRHQVYSRGGSLDKEAAAKAIYFRNIYINTDTNRVFKNDMEIILTEIEFQILLLLASERKKIFSVQNIYESVWNDSYLPTSNNTVNVHIRNLRKKIEGDPPERVIVNIWGKGYRID